MERQVINYMPLLNKMAKAGVIELHPQTGTKITALYGSKNFTCYYVKDAPKSTFQFGKWDEIYQLKYVSGCFCPYVFRVRNAWALYFKDTMEFACLFDYANFAKIDRNKFEIVRIN